MPLTGALSASRPVRKNESASTNWDVADIGRIGIGRLNLNRLRIFCSIPNLFAFFCSGPKSECCPASNLLLCRFPVLPPNKLAQYPRSYRPKRKEYRPFWEVSLLDLNRCAEKLVIGCGCERKDVAWSGFQLDFRFRSIAPELTTFPAPGPESVGARRRTGSSPSTRTAPVP